MLTNVKKKTRVRLANGLMGTVTDVQDGWRSATVSIRPDGGKFRTRQYNLSGQTLDGNTSLYVVEVLTTDVKEQLEKAKAIVAELQDVLEAEAQDGYEETLIDFNDGNGPVKARRHLNPEGDFGGYVASTATVESGARISRGSQVFGNARIYASARLKNKARVGGSTAVISTLDGVEVINGVIRAIN